MTIVVCIKQVPASQEGRMDTETGVLIRDGQTRLNPFDLYPLELALQLRERHGGQVIALTMGPAGAVAVLREAFALGADRGVLLCHPAFAGADVLATTRALAGAIRALGPADCILCGRQTTDGDTAQVGPALAAQLGLPVAGWVTQVEASVPHALTLRQSLSQEDYRLELPLPALLCVEPDAVRPRLPTLRLKLAAAKKELETLGLAQLADSNPAGYGLVGSPTRVERIFLPERTATGLWLAGDADQLAHQLAALLLPMAEGGAPDAAH